MNQVNDCLVVWHEQQYKNFMASMSCKLNNCLSNYLKVSYLAYVLMVETQLGLLIAKLATESSRLNR